MTAKHTPAQTLDRPPITEREDALLHAARAALPFLRSYAYSERPNAQPATDALRTALRAYDPPAPGAIAPEDPRAILRAIRALWPDGDEEVNGGDMVESIGALIPRIDAALAQE